MDLYIARGNASSHLLSELYSNNGNGTFSNVSSIAFPSAVPQYNGHIAWGDFDRDGLIDLYENHFDASGPSLWHNLGGFRFEDQSSKIVSPGNYATGVVWSDFDSDGYPDLLLSTQAGLGTLIERNLAGASFTQDSLFTNTGQGHLLLSTDLNLDGIPDYYVANIHSVDQCFVSSSSGYTNFDNSFLNSHRNNDGFQTAAFADLNADGYPDLLYCQDDHLFLLRNDSGRSFVDMTASSGLILTPGVYRSSFIQDIDNDGYLDVILLEYTGILEIWYGGPTGFRKSLIQDRTQNSLESVCGWTDFDNDGFIDFTIVTPAFTRLLRSSGNSNLWLSVELRGHRANSEGIGSRVIAYTKGTPQYREVGYTQGTLGYSPLMAHFGFGSPGCEASSGVIDSLVILWQPGGRQVLTNVRYNQTILVDQDSGIVRAFQRPLSVSNGYAYPQYDNTVQATVGQSVTIPVALRFPLAVHVDTMTVSSVTFSLSYDPNVIDINAAKMSQYYSPPAGWIFKSGSIHGDTVTVTMGNAGGSMLANPTDLGRLRFDTYKNNPDRSMLFFCGASISTRGDTKVFCGDIEGSLLTVVIVSDTVSSSVASGSCPNTTDLSLQPNPSSGGVVKVHFPFKDDSRADLRIVDMLGRTVYSANGISVPSSAGIAELLIPAGAVKNAGAYRVEVTTPVQTLVTRFVVVQ
ncbi:MAG: VCBS repeat-containing protein [Bacteroidetes bacterium]|nr:VCBS repeat-containing protein [Bacteroidota bacterium]